MNNDNATELSKPSSEIGTSPHFVDDSQDQLDVAAWEEVSSGRFMPRRVRGSCVGRALG